jgi:glycosyltransferase involved in cell wall biosynthesis
MSERLPVAGKRSLRLAWLSSWLLPFAPMRPAAEPATLEGRRILILTGLYPTADLPVAGLFVRQRVDRLTAAGVAVSVAAPHGYTGSVLARYVRLGLEGVVQARGSDGIEAHFLVPTGLIGLVAAALWRLPFIAVAHGSDVSYTAWRNPVLNQLARIVVARAAAVVANSRATADLVARLGGRAHVIPPGVDMSLFRLGPSARSELALPPGPLALFVGPAEEHKGADIFLEGVRRVGWQGLLIGRGHASDPGEGVASRAPMEPERLVRYIRSVDCVVVPSRREGLSLVAIEAAACGIPVVASPVGGLPEVVIDGVNGVVMDGMGPAHLAAALDRLAGLRFDPEAVRATVARFSLDEVTREMECLWLQVLSPDARRPRSPARQGHTTIR